LTQDDDLRHSQISARMALYYGISTKGARKLELKVFEKDFNHCYYRT